MTEKLDVFVVFLWLLQRWETGAANERMYFSHAKIKDPPYISKEGLLNRLRSYSDLVARDCESSFNSLTGMGQARKP